MRDFFATSIPGTEPALCEELRELGFKSVRLTRGGIPFRGEWREGWRACLQSRIAQRIHVLLARFPAAEGEALYEGVQSIDWSEFLSPQHTLAVSSVCRGSALDHSGFVALKTKDAIVDQFRAATSQRPSVDREDPDLRVFVYIADNKVALYADLSGDSLHRRGYRLDAGEAPLRETLASAILRLSGWDRTSPLIDPMCGSGTIAIEAAQWAANLAPGLSRGRFGFERWARFSAEDGTSLRELCGELRAAVNHDSPRIVASDVDDRMLAIAKRNARAAVVKLAFRKQSVLDLQADEKRRWVVTNPPYGLRLETDADWCPQLASALTRLHGWRVCMLSGAPEYERAIPLQALSSTPLPNGKLPCDFLVYDVP